MRADQCTFVANRGGGKNHRVDFKPVIHGKRVVAHRSSRSLFTPARRACESSRSCRFSSIVSPREVSVSGSCAAVPCSFRLGRVYGQGADQDTVRSKNQRQRTKAAMSSARRAEDQRAELVEPVGVASSE